MPAENYFDTFSHESSVLSMLIKTDIFNEKAKSKFCAVPPYWLADGFSMNGFAISGECLSSAESGVAVSLSVNCRRIVKGGRGGGTGLLAGQTNSFVNWRRQVRSRVREKLAREKVDRGLKRRNRNPRQSTFPSSSAGKSSAG